MAYYGVQAAGPSPDETQHRPSTQQLNELLPLFAGPPTLLELMLTLFGPLWMETLFPLLMETLPPSIGGSALRSKPPGISTHGMPAKASSRACAQKSIGSGWAIVDAPDVQPKSVAANAMTTIETERRTDGSRVCPTTMIVPLAVAGPCPLERVVADVLDTNQHASVARGSSRLPRASSMCFAQCKHFGLRLGRRLSTPCGSFR